MIAWFFLFFVAHADPVLQTAPQCACGATDRYEEPAQIGFGHYRGLCVDSCRFRRLQILKRDANFIVVGNLLHENRFWTAKIPLSKIREVNLEFEEFLPTINHVFLRFYFSSPVELTSQSSHDTRKLDDFVISAEGIPPKGHDYSFFDSSIGRYPLGVRILSMEEVYAHAVLKRHHRVTQYDLDLEKPERIRALLSALEDGDTRGFQSVYALLTNNCATAAVGYLTGATSFEAAIPFSGWIGTLHFLRARGLML